MYSCWPKPWPPRASGRASTKLWRGSLAIATVSGAGELMHRSNLDPKALRENVTSPGGTTAAALSVLMGENGLEKLAH